MSIMGKYYNLEKYLKNQCGSIVRLTFTEIEKILEEPLPPSAYKYREWWANGGHIQAESWLNAGCKVDKVEIGKEVTFSKATVYDNTNKREIKIGKKYRHFKGKEYLVLYVAKHSETLEEMVVYKALYGERGIWVRPLSMFLEQVKINGKKVNRFQEIE